MTQETTNQSSPDKSEELEKKYGNMSHGDLLIARHKAKTPDEQKEIAPFEHRAFAREYVEEKPVAGTLAMAVGIPAYQVAKATGILEGSRSGVSLEQVEQGYKGVGEGLEKVLEPWKMKWQQLKEWATSPEGKPISHVQEAPQTPRMPWEMGWEALHSQKVSPAPVEAPKALPDDVPDNKFETVFDNLVQQESKGKHFTDGKLTTSGEGAQGITQLMPKTGKDPGYGVAPLKNNTEKEFIRFGRDYLTAMLGEFDGDYEKALAAYNYGIGNVKKKISKYGADWKEKLPKETKNYLINILGKPNATKR